MGVFFISAEILLKNEGIIIKLSENSKESELENNKLTCLKILHIIIR